MTLKRKVLTKRSVVVVSICAVLLFFTVWQRIQAVRLGYDVQSLTQQISQQQNENNRLRLKIYRLSSLEKLDHTAKTRLGLVLPQKENVVMVLDGQGSSMAILAKAIDH